MEKQPLIAVQIERGRAHGRAMLEGLAAFAQEKTEWRLEQVEPEQLLHDPHLERFDGLIVRVMDEATAGRLKALRKPVIDTYGRIDANPLPFIRLDDGKIAALAAETLLDHRFSEFGYCGFCGLRFSEARGQAFAAEIAARGGHCSVYRDDGKGRIADRFFQHEQTGKVPDAAALRRWVKKLPKPVAVFCCNDLRAYQLLQTCSACGIRVPEDVAVLGVDNDTILCTFTHPSLSSIDTDPCALGRTAAEMLARALTGERPAPVLHPPHHLVERLSTSVYPFRTPWLSDALVFIARHLGEGISAMDVFAHTGLSHTAVNRAFRAELGQSVQKEIIRQRLVRAQRLLRTTDLSAAAVAAACGYPSAQYFSHAFSAAAGTTPDRWRQTVEWEIPPT